MSSGIGVGVKVSEKCAALFLGDGGGGRSVPSECNQYIPLKWCCVSIKLRDFASHKTASLKFGFFRHVEIVSENFMINLERVSVIIVTATI
jgi:hypothetical protein